MSFLTKERSASPVLMLAMIVALGVAVGGLNLVGPQRDSQFAQAASAEAKPADITSQSCDAAKQEAIKQAPALMRGTQTSEEKLFGDKCIAAIFLQSLVKPNDPKNTPDPKKNPDNYQCTGKLVQVNVTASGKETETWVAKPGTKEGFCDTIACDSEGHCIAAKNIPGTQFTSSAVNQLMDTNSAAFKQAASNNMATAFQYGTTPSADTKILNDVLSGPTFSSPTGAGATGSVPDDSAFKALQALSGGSGSGGGSAISSPQGNVLTVPPAGQATSDLTDKDFLCQGQPCASNGTPEPPKRPDNVAGCPGGNCSDSTFGKAPDNSASGACPGNPGCPSNLGGTGPAAGGNSSAGKSGSGSGLFSGMGSGLTSFLGGLMQGVAKAFTPQAQAPTCPTDPNAYAQQQQQYNYQLQQYNYQLQQYNNQLRQDQYDRMNGYSVSYGGFGATAPTQPTPPQPCQPATNTPGGATGNPSGVQQLTQCPVLPPQPDASQCPNGTWRQMTTTQVTGSVCPAWQCVPTAAVTPTAQISCQPQVADVGASIAISYSCANATGSAGFGFETGNQTSGNASSSIEEPPQGATSKNFSIRCINQNLSSSAQCSVQIAKPAIAIVANPKTVKSGDTTVVGWTTSGMESCIVSSPQLPEFTAANADRTNVNGVATTPPITKSASFLLTCQTAGGATKIATTSVAVATSTSTGAQGTVHSSIDSTQGVALGTSASVQWQFANPPANSAVSLWLFDTAANREVALIRGGLAPSGSFNWRIPGTADACDLNLPFVCASDIVAGGQYSIEAALYTPVNAFLGGPNQTTPDPQYIFQAMGGVFRMQ